MTGAVNCWKRSMKRSTARCACAPAGRRSPFSRSRTKSSTLVSAAALLRFATATAQST